MLHFEIGQRVRYTFFCYTAFTENQIALFIIRTIGTPGHLYPKKSRDTPWIKTGLYNHTMCKTTEKLTSYKVHMKQIYMQLISYTFLKVKNRDQKFEKKKLIIGGL